MTAEGALCETCQSLPQFEQILAITKANALPVSFQEDISASLLNFQEDTSQEPSCVEFSEDGKHKPLGNRASMIEHLCSENEPEFMIFSNFSTAVLRFGDDKVYQEDYCKLRSSD